MYGPESLYFVKCLEFVLFFFFLLEMRFLGADNTFEAGMYM